MKKLNTHIKGMDLLFHGGIQVDSLTSSKSNKNDSIVIVIRGERGSYKHLLAMQLMHGLTMSINDRLKKQNERGFEKHDAAFYSISKPVSRLNDMYIDLLINRWIDAMTHAVKRRQNNIIEGRESKTYVSNRENDRQAVLKFWFDFNQNATYYPAPTQNRQSLSSFYDSEMPTLLAENIVNYNPRTNSIHYRRLRQGDSDDSLLYMRYKDTIEDYIDLYKQASSDIRNYREVSESYEFDSELINVKFTYDISKDDEVIERNSKEATIRFFKIIRKLEEELANREKVNDGTANDAGSLQNSFIHEVAVIDGFSHIDSKTLQTLPYNYLQNILRKYARISILVFDDRDEIDCDGDIVIDLRKSDDETEKYTYYKLQIVKSIFQTYALGWHQYKPREEGIVVFPSIHLLLTKRHYLANRIHDIGMGILNNTYEQFLESKVHSDSAKGILRSYNYTQMREYFNEFYYEDYNESEEEQAFKMLRKIIANQHYPSLIQSPQKGSEMPIERYVIDGAIAQRILETSLLGFPTPHDTYEDSPFGWVDHYPSTAIVGNPNSYKRKLVLSHAFHWAKRKEHILFVLFDKNEEDIRKQMLCPAIADKIDLGKKYTSDTNKLSTCLNCYKYIHFFRVRSGCITPDEFFSTLLEQISIYCDEDPEYNIEKRRLHIIIDDFQRIDFCFPFIKKSSLFTDALINICHQHNVELTILCDKSGERAREVCTLADNVLCVERNECDINRISIYVERTSIPPYPSTILKYRVENVEDMFSCGSNNLAVDKNRGRISYELLGSMKEYWRQTANVFIKKHEEESKDKNRDEK